MNIDNSDDMEGLEEYDSQYNYDVLVSVIRTLQACHGPMQVYCIPNETFAKWNGLLCVYIRVIRMTIADVHEFRRQQKSYQDGVEHCLELGLSIQKRGGVSPTTAADFFAMCQTILAVSQTTEQLMDEDGVADDRLADMLAGLEVRSTATLHN